MTIAKTRTSLSLTGIILSTVLTFIFAYSGQLQASDTKSRAGGNVSVPFVHGAVIEIVTFKLRQGVTVDEFRPLDKLVELEHVSKQPGFISRESAAGNDGEWLVIVHWRSIADADASMKSFPGASAAEKFMSKLNVNTMSMKRYVKPR